MTYAELISTHENVTEVAIVGKPCYAIDEDGIITIWNGDRWEDGVFRVDGDEVVRFDPFSAEFGEI